MGETRPAVVIGYGNTLRTDDAVGQHAAAAVQSWNLPGVAAIAVTQLAPELAASLSTARLAVFVDAIAVSNGGPGGVEVTRIKPSGVASAFGHTSDASYVLALAEAVYGNCPMAWLVSVPAADIGVGDGLTEAASLGLADALNRIAELLAEPFPDLAGVTPRNR